MLEGVVREARDAREERRVRGRRAGAFDGDGVEVPHVRQREPAGGGRADPLVRSREVLQHDDAALGVARVAQHSRNPPRRRGVVAEREHPGAGPDRGPKRRGRAPVQGEGVHVREVPAEARAGEAEGGRSGVNLHLVRREVRRDCRADPVAERVAGREHAHAASRASAKLVGEGGERARPLESLAAVRRDHREVPGAADQGLRRLDGGAGGRAESVEAVLPDPDDGEPRAHVILLPRSR